MWWNQEQTDAVTSCQRENKVSHFLRFILPLPTRVLLVSLKVSVPSSNPWFGTQCFPERGLFDSVYIPIPDCRLGLNRKTLMVSVPLLNSRVNKSNEDKQTRSGPAWLEVNPISVPQLRRWTKTCNIASDTSQLHLVKIIAADADISWLLVPTMDETAL